MHQVGICTSSHTKGVAPLQGCHKRTTQICNREIACFLSYKLTSTNFRQPNWQLYLNTNQTHNQTSIGPTEHYLQDCLPGCSDPIDAEDAIFHSFHLITCSLFFSPLPFKVRHAISVARCCSPLLLKQLGDVKPSWRCDGGQGGRVRSQLLGDRPVRGI